MSSTTQIQNSKDCNSRGRKPKQVYSRSKSHVIQLGILPEKCPWDCKYCCIHYFVQIKPWFCHSCLSFSDRFRHHLKILVAVCMDMVCCHTSSALLFSSQIVLHQIRLNQISPQRKNSYLMEINGPSTQRMISDNELEHPKKMLMMFAHVKDIFMTAAALLKKSQ